MKEDNENRPFWYSGTKPLKTEPLFPSIPLDYNGKIKTYKGDCLVQMDNIEDGSIDMVLCDLPYGTLQCEWDNVIPFEPLWRQYKRVTKETAAIVLFSQTPFNVDLIQSNREMFRYEWIWEKTKAMGFLGANKMPLRAHENICVFYRKLPTYNPQKTIAEKKSHSYTQHNVNVGGHYGDFKPKSSEGSYERFPRDVIKFANKTLLYGKDYNNYHPTQKPVDLLAYLIKTYTNEGETVLDNCMGGGSTGVACVHTNRNFIGIEKDEDFFNVAVKRIDDTLRGII